MIRLTLDDRQLLEMMRNAPHELVTYLEQGLDRVAQEYARPMLNNITAEATGLLRKSIRVTNAGPLQRDVGAHTDYARMVEEGTGPGGWAKMRSIADWAKRKRLQPMAGESYRDMVWKIRRAIARRGTRAQPFVSPVEQSPAMRARGIKLMQEAARRGMEAARS